MIAWLSENLATIVIALFLLVIVAAIVVRMVRNKRMGKSSCSCGCSSCAMNGACHKDS